ncbi:PREDICTED: abhydrolase domain-containing protein 8-like [Priapulus caudatus]|uniref:acylglycerol lipase n=1 Tax=Priapulus caudatus TaxID=37621 RepID=A0ABM1E7K7_PRICU|nr:PREDICTED: abhydrolase domain-containing protein 8-like [Priapulus caudatus]
MSELAIFFVHGVGCSGDVWREQLQYFSQLGCTVVVPDLLGHGFSGTPDDASAYEFQQMALDMLAVFDYYHRPNNVVVGHSYGTSLVTVLARERQHLVSGMVLVSGGGPTPLSAQPGIFCMPACLLSCMRPALMSFFEKRAFRDVAQRSNRDKAVTLDIPMYVMKHVINGQRWKEGDLEYHTNVTVPTLLLFGMDDRFVGLQDECDMLEALVGSRLEILEGAGHMVMMEKPGEVNILIHDFISSDPVKQADQPRGNAKLSELDGSSQNRIRVVRQVTES